VIAGPGQYSVPFAERRNHHENAIHLSYGRTALPDCRAALDKAIAALRADREVALAMFNNRERGFKNSELYPFCSRLRDGKFIAGPVYVRSGTDGRTLWDSTGKAYGVEQLDGAAQKPEGEVFEVSYRAPRPGTTAPEFQKVSFITRVGDLACGVGYYK
jgi:hypothetical protein